MSYGERIPIKTRRELEAMRDAGRHVAEVLLELRERVRPGITTAELDAYAEKAIGARGVESSFKGYDPHGLPAYPAVLCVSVNDEIVHGIPGPRELRPGDVVSLDFSGWAVFTRADAPDDFITAFCRALEARKDRIPWQGEGPLPLERMCRNTADAPLVIPLHPAAERFWRDCGYLP